MTEQHKTDFFLKEAQVAFSDSLPNSYEHIRFPSIDDKHPFPFPVRMVWTLDQAKPRWDNLAVIADVIDPSVHHDLDWWRQVSDEFGIPLTVLAHGNEYIVRTRPIQGEATEQTVSTEELRQTLEAKRQELFAPSKLAAIRGGQLTFADLDSLTPATNIPFRHRTKLNNALKHALVGALQAERQSTGKDSVAQHDAAVIEVAIAYLAARILADKGFFGLYNPNNQDPKSLIQITTEHTNGFFSLVNRTQLHMLSDETLQQLAAYLGPSVTFALIDDYDVGYVYEQSILLLNKPSKNKAFLSLGKIAVPNLQQHYTPRAIAERMLTSLPLERLRPEERVIYDPAAGSGTLLLAATKRLAAMSDIPSSENNQRYEYLATHVMGNDIDTNAKLINRIRYALVQETILEQFPAPTHFCAYNYEEDAAWQWQQRPRVLVANPPFAEESRTQQTVTFLHQTLKHLQDGDQFAFILPQSFLTAKTHGWQETRKLVAERSHILETWQLPEGVVGLKSRQSTCVVSGIVGEKKSFSIARAIISGTGQKLIREEGFLGQTWIGTINSEQWQEVIAPVPFIHIPTIALRSLFSVSTGLNLKKSVKPIADTEQNTSIYKFWEHRWRIKGTLLADTRSIPTNQQYIRATDLRHMPDNEGVLVSRKILVPRSTNRGASEPHAAYFDMYGLSPTNDMFCIVPKTIIEDINESFDTTTWNKFTDDERMYWLLGILSSSLATNIIMPTRDHRHLHKENLDHFPLPTIIDHEIITIVEEIMQKQMQDAPATEMKLLREQLNNVVEKSYGNPKQALSLVRTGEIPDVQHWQRERKENPIPVTGQVVKVHAQKNKILVSIDGLLDDDKEVWIPLPPELPGWALDGTVFSAEISETVETFADLKKRPWTLRNVEHTSMPYLSLSELQKELLALIEVEI